MPNPNIRFPILRRLVVKDYGLFPGKNGKGIDHRFEPGVTVIPGANGLGKTTLLNIIYRLLVGPFDPFKGEERIQLTQTRLKKLRFYNYFSKRDRAASTNATALGEFSFGERTLRVTRRLSDLSITDLAIDGKDISTDEIEEPENQIWRLAGSGSQYDFHLLVRSVLFFLEEKNPVVWDPIAQAEVFRILFLKGDEASELSQLASEIQILDSRARNMTDQLRRYKSELARTRAQSSAVLEVTKRSRYIEERLPLIERQLANLTEAEEQLELIRNTSRAKLDALKLDLEEATRELELKHHQYFASLFPRLNETAKNVLTNLVGENGCLVCGNRRSGLSSQFRQLAEAGACPICRSPREEQEQMSSAAHFGSKTIKRETAKVDNLKREVAESQGVVNSNEEDYKKVLGELLEVLTEQENLQSEARELRALLPPSTEEVSETENYVRLTQNEIQKLRRKLKALLNRYSDKLNALHKEVKRNRKNFASFFSDYAGSFLAERCSLTFAPQKLQLGQAVERVEYPTFAVQMTSAVTPSAGTTRSHDDDVSESQKEFIDLAFRMAVLKAYGVSTNVPRGAMIVIETPESSLDSVFIGNAGEMLRNWCADPAPGANSVIATSNLNRENMIGALLGLNERPQPTKAVVSKHIINLLEVAAENATLKLHRKAYEEQFRQSTTPKGQRG